MAADYLIAVWIRYALFLAACGIARGWVLPDAWSETIAAGTLLYALVIVHTEPAARYARGLRDPWYGWMALSAACAHAFGAAVVYALIPLVDVRYEPPDASGMRFETLWVNEPSLLETGFGIGVYALVSAVWAVAIGWTSRGVWGAVAPDAQRVRIRTPAGTAGRRYDRSR